MRSHRATHNQMAVSAGAAETAINAAQTLDTSLLCGLDNVLGLTPRREDNSNELTGHEEPDTIYDNGAQTEGSLSFEKAQPQHFAFLLAYGLGRISSASAGSGYIHTITPIDGDVDLQRSLPSFTAAQRFGKTVFTRLFASCFVNQFTATFEKDAWVKCSGDIVGTGKATGSLVSEEITAAGNATALSLAANAVEGADAAARLDNVHQVKVKLAGESYWREAAYSDVSAGTPAEITIAAPSESTEDATYKVLYAPTAPAWTVFPARVAESPLRVAESTIYMGGQWDGTAFQGGRELSSDVKSLEWTLSNNLAVEFAPGAGGAYASNVFRDGREQTIKLSRELRDYIVQQVMTDTEYFGLRVLARGAAIDETHHYGVEIVWPRVGVLTAPLSVDGKRLAEAGDLRVLEDAVYGSVIINVTNKVAAYAA